MIIVKLYGGIGNQMFQYAMARSLANKNKTSFKLDITHYNTKILPNGLPYRSYDLSVFNVKGNIATKQELLQFQNNTLNLIGKINRKVKTYINPFKVIYEPYFQFCPNIFDIKGNIYLEGYWQSEKYFTEIEDIIRKEFEIKQSLTGEGLKMLDTIRNSNSVCLNIRRQEFASNPFLNLFVGLEYIQNAIEHMNKKLKEPHFFIFSDELEWVKENLFLQYPYTIVENNLYGEKFKDCLFLMTNCKHFIIPNSTFGWWAAWLSSNKSKIVIAPKRWFSDPNKNTNDLIPSNWIKI